MATATLVKQIDIRLERVLKLHQIAVSQPRESMLQLEAVPLGRDFNHPFTNVLLRQSISESVWQVFVDEDLVYTGDDPVRKKAFQGTRRRGWMQLAAGTSVKGSPNEAIVWFLIMAKSDLEHQATKELQSSDSSDEDDLPFAGNDQPNPLDLVDRRLARVLDIHDLNLQEVRPTATQLDAITLAAESVLRRLAPNCPLLMGPSGVGKTTVARLAAHELARRNLVQKVVEVRGSAICAGSIFWPERDERLRATLELLSADKHSLVIFEQFDLALARSDAASSLICDGLDFGIKMIVVARADCKTRTFCGSSDLCRRLEPQLLLPPDEEDLIDILKHRLEAHPHTQTIEVAPNVLPIVVELSRRRLGVNPGAALGLLEAVMNRAGFSGRDVVGPDDVYHLSPQTVNP